MTLVFKGHSFKYEIEAVVKLFLPVVHFDFVYEGDISEQAGDFCYTERAENVSYSTLTAVCRINGSTESKSTGISRKESGYDGLCELKLCALLFGCLEKLTGKRPAWGILTGVRPVKRVNSMLNMGFSKEKIFEVLMNDFLCSEDKCALAYATAMTQNSILSETDENGFSLYVSIPFCPSRCSYCSFVSQEVERSLKLIPQYISKLCREIEYTGRIASELGLELVSVYFGGGTPTSLETVYIETLMRTVEKSFDMSGLKEYTVEAGRADTITEDKLRAIKYLGADRVSINPQTLNNDVLKAVGRKHTAEDFFEKFELARKIGFGCINTDLIAGLPTDAEESFARTIDGIIGISPENVTVHTLSVKRTSNINLLSGNGKAIAENSASGMTAYASKRLSSCGYRPYYLYRQKNMLDNQENTGWSKPGHESLYNINIMEETQTILAVGAGASTKLVDSKAGNIERIFNRKLPLEYLKNFDSELEKKKAIEGFYKK